jgi:hypothetical protein
MMKETARKRSLTLGTRVSSRDGQVGCLSKIILQRESMSPAYLVIRLENTPREVLIPVSYVQMAAPGEIVLKTSLAETVVFPDFENALYPAGPDRPAGQIPKNYSGSQPGYQPGYLKLKGGLGAPRLVPVKAGTPIIDCFSEQVGVVQGIVFEAGSRRGRYVIFSSPEGGPSRLLPASLVAEATTAGLRLFIDQPYIDKLPIFAESG